MDIVSIDSCWKELIPDELIEALDSTPFLVKCRNGIATRRELNTYIVQQYFYSKNFTRFLCALLSNMSNEEERLWLTENLLEEIGTGQPGSLPHSRIYRNMMVQMGIHSEKFSVLATTQRLIDAMYKACRHPDPVVGLAALCLGAEAIVPHAYSQVVNGLHAIGVPDSKLEFFLIHIACDDKHAATMKNIIESELKRNPANKGILQKTAKELLTERKHFFLGLAQETSQPVKLEREVHVQLQGFC